MKSPCAKRGYPNFANMNFANRTFVNGESPLYFRQYTLTTFAIGECTVGESLIGEIREPQKKGLLYAALPLTLPFIILCIFLKCSSH
jgi:hypothetical protein